MGREMGTTPEGARILQVIKEPSINARPSVSEVTRQPSATEGMLAAGEGLWALGREVKRIAEPTLSKVFGVLNRERTQALREAVQGDPEEMTREDINIIEADADAAEVGFVELEEHASALETRDNGQKAIITELEKVEAEL